MEEDACCEATTNDVLKSQASDMGTETLQGDRQGSKTCEEGRTVTGVSQARHGVFVACARTGARLQKIEDTVGLREVVVAEKSPCMIEEDVVDTAKFDDSIMTRGIEKNKDIVDAFMNKNEDIMDKTEGILDARLTRNEDMDAGMSKKEYMYGSMKKNEDIMQIDAGVYNEDTMDYADLQFLAQPSRMSHKRKLAGSSDLPALKRCHTCGF